VKEGWARGEGADPGADAAGADRPGDLR